MATRSDDLQPQDSDEPILTVKEHSAVLNELPDFSEWRTLGRNLGIDVNKLDVVNKDHRDVGECLEEVIKYWLKRNHNEKHYGPPTWSSLAKAVEPIDNALACNIRGKYGIRSTSVLIKDSPSATATQPWKRPAREDDDDVKPNEKPLQGKHREDSNVRLGTNRSRDHPSYRKQSEGGYSLTKIVAIVAVAILSIAVGTSFTGKMFPPSLPSRNPAPTCEFPRPNSDKFVKFQEEQVKMDLGLKEMSDDLKIFIEQVSKASTAGDTCSDNELSDKMKSVGSGVTKVKERVRNIFEGFQKGATTTLADLKAMWDFVAKGEMEQALHRLQSVYKTTDFLAKQVDSLEKSMKSKGSEIRRARDALESNYKKAKEKYENQKRKLEEEKQDHTERASSAQSSVVEAEEKARGAEDNAQKETKELEKLKAQNIAFGSDDQNPFKRRRAEFLKLQQTYESQAEDYRRDMLHSQRMIAGIKKKYEVQNAAFKCVDDAMTKMNEAFDGVSMPTLNIALFEQDLKNDCTDLVNEIKSAASSFVPGDLSQVCDKAKSLFGKWQALLNVSEDYLFSGEI